MKKIYLLILLCCLFGTSIHAQKIKLNFAGNLLDSSSNHYLLDTNNCGSTLNFCDDASGNANNAYQFDGTCTMQTDSFSMTSTSYPGMSLSFYMSKNFDSDTMQYGLFNFYKGSFLVYAFHDSMFVIITDSTNNSHTYGAPCNFPNNEWFCAVISMHDYGDVDFYFNKVKYNAGTTNYKILRRACDAGFCYSFYASFELWDKAPFKGKLDDVRVWEWPSDSMNVDEICTKTIVPLPVSSFSQSGAKLYPNPTQDYILFESQEAGKITIMDIFGRILLSQQTQQGINRIELHQLAQGNYIFLYSNAKGKYSQKIMVEGN